MNLQEARNILGVSPDASKDDIKKAYRSMAMKWHPDRQTGEEKKKEASEKFAKISTAHEILLDPQQAQGGFFRNHNSMNRDWFNERKKRYSPMQHGKDIFTHITISLEEAVKGLSKKIRINRPCVCSSCNGLGMKNGASRRDCSSCNGSGYVVMRQKIMGAEFNTRHNCPTCQGVGSIIAPEDNCKICKGRKTVNKFEDVDIDIPSGVRTGIKLGANDLGGEGIAGGRNGRLFIDIEVDEHEHYKIIEETDHLRLNYNISYGQHYSGETIEIKTIYGDKIDVKIPPSHNIIDPIIKHGHGLPDRPFINSNNTEKGDLHIYLNIKGPHDMKEKVIDELKYKVENPIENYK